MLMFMPSICMSMEAQLASSMASWWATMALTVVYSGDASWRSTVIFTSFCFTSSVMP